MERPLSSRLALSRRPALLAGLLFGLTLALFARTWSFGFLAYDDDVYVSANPGVRGGLGWSALQWAFTTGHAANWHPLTWLSHQLDVQLFGLDAGAHHRTNGLLHALNAALVFLALRALTGASGRSVLVAAFFALHPMRVEVVAWVSERKELLAAGFGLASLWAWAHWARRGCPGAYGLALACFALGLLAKPMLVTLPFLLLLLDFWPLGRLARGPERVPWSRLLGEKAPFLLLSVASSLVTLRVQAAGGAMGPLAEVALPARLANAAVATWTYLARSVWPHGLAAFHPHPGLAAPGSGWTLEAGLACGVLVLLTGLALRHARRAPYACVGWLWFLGMLVPVLGLVQVGLQGWAERYTYLPSIGLALAVVWGGTALARTPVQRSWALGIAALALGALALASVRQAGFWRDTRTLFERALRVDESAVAHVMLANDLEASALAPGTPEANARAALEQARSHDERALELLPALTGARVNLARVLQRLGRPEEAERVLVRAVDDEPALVPALAALGWLLVEEGRDAEGLVHLREAVRLAPRDPELANRLAWVLATSRTAAAPEEALERARVLVRGAGASQGAYLETLAAAHARLGHAQEAVRWQTRALELVPAAQRQLPQERLALYRAGEAFLKTP